MSAHPVEVELKLRVARAEIPTLRQRIGRLARGRRFELDSVYHDTPDRLLARHRLALRVRRVVALDRRAAAGRREGAGWLQTLKSGDDGHALSHRGEWETAAPHGRLDLRRFGRTPLSDLLAAQAGPPVFLPVFRTRFVRELWVLQHQGARLEVALDRGAIVVELPGATRGHTEAIDELEIEVKDGPAWAAVDLACRLMQPPRPGGRLLALLPYGDAKAVRGWRLAEAATAAPERADAASFRRGLEASMPITAALRSMLAEGARVLETNLNLVIGDRDPDGEAVHQARVALRRMRSAVRLVRRHVVLPAPLGEDLAWVAAALGPMRDWHVMSTQTLPALLEGLPPALRAEATALQRVARQRRDRAHRSGRRRLQGPRTARALLGLSFWVHAPWTAATPADPAEAPPPIGDFARDALQRSTRRLLAQARFFAGLSAEARHRVRIRAKRLRYAVEWLQPLLPRHRATAVLAPVRPLLDALGEMNDAAVAQRTLAELGASPRLLAAVRERQRGRELAQVPQAERWLARLAKAARGD